MIKKFFYFFTIFSIFIIIYANVINFTNAVSDDTDLEISPSSQISYFIPTNSEELFWPTPGYHNITSKFGGRISPITKNSPIFTKTTSSG